MIERDIVPELDFPKLSLYDDYLKASRVYINRPGAVSRQQIELFEALAFEDIANSSDEDNESLGSELPSLGEGLDAKTLVGGDKVAYTLGLLKGIVGL